MSERVVEKPFDCARARRDLLAAPAAAGAGTQRHLGACGSCAAFAERLAAARASLEAHRSEALPDVGFAARVTAALPPRRGQRDAMGWAAIRLLPATLALALALGAWCWIRTPLPADLTASAPTDDVLTWVLENGSERP